ncbi:autoinducer-2 kinase [Microvirga sp. GCM10011540]|uniref:autoinducer-2 kinase n=1 Tax=Microvirga sp. GCM10011540 TaxID=3317338 RepID=UPI00361A0B9D
MTNALVMAIDAGTGSCRAIIFDTKGDEIGAAQREWTHHSDPAVPSSFDFDTEANGKLIDAVISEALSRAAVRPDQIRAVSTTSMREGIVIYDRQGKEIWACPNIDSRASAEAEALVESGVAAKVFQIAGDWVSITTPARLKWIAAHRPDILSRARHIGLISDWAATRLTGEFWTEPSAGSSTALFDIGQRTWSGELFDVLDIDLSICPPVVESGSQIGKVTAEAAARTGLAQGTPVIAGGGDTQLGLLGLGRRVGDGTLIGGSFWQMTVLLDHPFIDPARGPRTLCHARPGQWMVEGIGFLTGLSLRWFRDAFCDLEKRIADEKGVPVFDLLMDTAASVPPGANGVTAVMANVMQSDSWVQASPTLLGFDFNDPEGHGKAAALRAIMESAAYVSYSHRLELERVTGTRFDAIQFTGGGARGSLWPQIIADVMGLPVSIPQNRETTALGCAMLAAVGGGLFANLDEARAMLSPIERVVEPDAARHEAYKNFHARWHAINDAMVMLADAGVTQPMWKPAGAIRRGGAK